MILSDGSFSIGSSVWPGTSKLLEEMGELTQVLGKLLGTHGELEHWDGTNLLERLYAEIGDVIGAIDFFIHQNKLDIERIGQRSSHKLALFREWQAAQ